MSARPAPDILLYLNVFLDPSLLPFLCSRGIIFRRGDIDWNEIGTVCAEGPESSLRQKVRLFFCYLSFSVSAR